MITQEQYLALSHNIRRLHIKLELLNEEDQVVGNLEGIATAGSINFDATSAYRRTGNITMVLDSAYNLLPNESSKLWFNKRVSVYAGLEYGEVQWFHLGKFAIGNIQVSRSSASQTLNCELLDYMAFLDGTLGGVLPITTLIPAGTTTISEAVRAAVSYLPRTAIDIIEVDGFPADVPIDIEKPSGSSVYELVKTLVDFYKNYEFYFDVNGFFRLHEIRKRKTDPITWDFTATPLSITDNFTLEMKNVKNSVWIWGDTLDTGVEIAWQFRNRWHRSTLAERDALTGQEMGDICVVDETGLGYYWDDDGAVWVELDFDVDPSLNIEKIGEKVIILDNTDILDVPQAQIRGKFLLIERSNFAQQVSFTTVPIYSLRPNTKIYISSPEVGVEGDYLITQMTLPLGMESSSITCKKIYY